ncbi:hypothetical protein X757_31845 [Mesorhizobium sp. LSHC414A00]|nr:hypothetical protein X757_31845 [Mesorhizobium sp. LSHC414A00]
MLGHSRESSSIICSLHSVVQRPTPDIANH